MNTDREIGRSLGVGEPRRLAKALNKEANENPSVTTGLRSGNQKTTPGFDIAQGLREAIQSSPDGIVISKRSGEWTFWKRLCLVGVVCDERSTVGSSWRFRVVPP